MKYPSDSQTREYLDKASGVSWARSNGTDNKPQQPRNLQVQSGSRGALVTWDMPPAFADIAGFRIYKDSENSLLDTIYDSNVRQYKIPLSSGAAPPVTNVFISAFNVRGKESGPVQAQVSATAEASAPSDPSPPSGSAADPIAPTGRSTVIGGGLSNKTDQE